MKEFVSYTLLRIALFVATYAVLGGIWLAIGRNVDATDSVVLVVLSAIISSVLSLKLLAGQRVRFAQKVEARATRATARFDELRAREDADQD